MLLASVKWRLAGTEEYTIRWLAVATTSSGTAQRLLAGIRRWYWACVRPLLACFVVLSFVLFRLPAGVAGQATAARLTYGRQYNIHSCCCHWRLLQVAGCFCFFRRQQRTVFVIPPPAIQGRLICTQVGMEGGIVIVAENSQRKRYTLQRSCRHGNTPVKVPSFGVQYRCCCRRL